MPADHSAMVMIGGQLLTWPICFDCEANGGQVRTLNPETMDTCRLLDILYDSYRAGDLSWEQLIFASKKHVPWWGIQGIWKAVQRAAREGEWAKAGGQWHGWSQELAEAAPAPIDPFAPKIVVVKTLADLKPKSDEQPHD